MTWRQLTERDCREWKLLSINPHDRDTWNSDVRYAMHASSQLPGSGPNDCPCTCTLIKIWTSMMMMVMTVKVPYCIKEYSLDTFQ